MADRSSGASRRAGLGTRFNRLWAASAAGNLGDGVYRVAIALLAARLTSDPVAFSVLAALGFLPWLLLGLPAGVLVDRQRLTPDALLGRTIGIYRVVAWGVMPLGALTGGVLAGAGDLRTPILVGALLTLAAGGYAAVGRTDSRVDAAVAEADTAAAAVSGGRGAA